MPTPRCCRYPSVIRTPPSPSITTVDAVSCDPRLGAPDLWHRADGRVEVRAGARLTPAALVQLASVCYALRQAGHYPVLRADDAAVREYWWRCGFLAVVHPVATVEPPLVIAPGADQEARASPLLFNVTRIATSAALPTLLDRMLGILRQRLHYRPDDACDVATAVSELCQNTFDHNAHAGAFLAMQVAGGADPRRLEIAIADDGAGLAATLRRKPHHAPLASDLEAIQLAVQRGTSAYDDPTRGTGLGSVAIFI
jgi:anti-sigma regulatory factor (Ser/Thr protein kinase)